MAAERLPKETSTLVAKGIPYVRALLAQRMGGNREMALEILRNKYPSDYLAIEHVKAAVAPGTTVHTTWASPLMQTTAAIEFWELARSRSVVGRLQGLRRVAFNINTAMQTAGMVLQWVGENNPTPVGKLQFVPGQLGVARLSGILPVTRELLQFGPLTEQILLNELSRAAAYFLDVQMFSPGITAIAQVRPASVLNGATAIQSTGSSAIQIANDLEDAATVLADADEITENTAWIMRPADAVRLAAKRDTAGAPAFPTVKVTGGTLLGLPLICTNALPNSVSAGSLAALVNPDGIAFADAGAEIDSSEHAAVDFNDNPSAGAQQLVSLWQQNLKAFKLDMVVNYQRVRSTSAVVLDNLHW